MSLTYCEAKEDILCVLLGQCWIGCGILYCIVREERGELEASSTPLDVSKAEPLVFVRMAHCTKMESGGSLDVPVSFDVCSD